MSSLMQKWFYRKSDSKWFARSVHMYWISILKTEWLDFSSTGTDANVHASCIFWHMDITKTSSQNYSNQRKG